MCRSLFFLLMIAALSAPSLSAAGPPDKTVVSTAEKETVSNDVSAQSRLTLEDCLRIALENNPDIAARQWDIETALAERDIAKGQFGPFISAEAGYTRYLDDQRLIPATAPGELATYTDNIFSGDVVLRMPLYTSGRLESQVKASEYLAESVRHRFVRSRRELIFNVSNVFYSILGQEEVVNSLVFSQKALQEHRKRVEELLNAQKAARVDLLRTEVRLADLEQNLLKERNVLHIQSSVLASLLGIERFMQPIEIEGQLTPTDFAAETHPSLELAFGQRRDYQAAKANVEAQYEILDAAKAGQWPIVSLEAAYGNRWAAGRTAGGSSTSGDVGRVGFVVALPLFEGGQIKARIRRERSRLSAQTEAVRKLQLQIQLEVETAVSNMASTKARVGSIEKAVEQGKESLRIEREKYDLGKGAIVDVLDAQAALLETQTSYYRAMADYNVAIAQWRLAVGEEL